jgi:hypothetical protein
MSVSIKTESLSRSHRSPIRIKIRSTEVEVLAWNVVVDVTEGDSSEVLTQYIETSDNIIYSLSQIGVDIDIISNATESVVNNITNEGDTIILQDARSIRRARKTSTGEQLFQVLTIDENDNAVIVYYGMDGSVYTGDVSDLDFAIEAETTNNTVTAQTVWELRSDIIGPFYFEFQLIQVFSSTGVLLFTQYQDFNGVVHSPASEILTEYQNQGVVEFVQLGGGPQTSDSWSLQEAIASLPAGSWITGVAWSARVGRSSSVRVRGDSSEFFISPGHRCHDEWNQERNVACSGRLDFDVVGTRAFVDVTYRRVTPARRLRSLNTTTTVL